MQWIKQGLIFNPSAIGSVPATHAQCPVPLLVGERLRLYFSWRPPAAADGQYRAQGGFLEVDPQDPSLVLYVHDQAILPLGAAGDFDHFGCMPGGVVSHGGRVYLYYCGWDRRVSVPYNWAIGLAVSEDGGRSFQRVGQGPVLGPTLDEPFLQACPTVRVIDGRWHMWYLSGLGWLSTATGLESRYVLMHAESDDGMRWRRNGKPLLTARVEEECQTSAALLERDGVHHMWFSYRHGIDFRNPARGYRIGHATSVDLRHWERSDDAAGIDLSPTGWDAEMQCYPSVISIGERTYMFYCGNQFGAGGFGYAELER